MQTLELLITDIIDKNAQGKSITEDLEFLLLAAKRQSVQYNVGKRLSSETIKVFKRAIYEQNFGPTKDVRPMEVTRKAREAVAKQLNLSWPKTPWSIPFFRNLFKEEDKAILVAFEKALEKHKGQDNHDNKQI